MENEVLTMGNDNRGEHEGTAPGNLEISFSLETITPEMAGEILRTQRIPDAEEDKKAIQTYAKVMAAGGWIVNGQTVIFDRNGKLIDGVQRLAACVEANVPFDTIVARNVRADTLHTIDQHRRRSYTGVLESRGIHNAGSVMRTTSKLIRIENGLLGIENAGLSWSRYDRVLDANPEIIEAVRMSDVFRGSTVHSTARPVLAFMARTSGKTSEFQDFMRGTRAGSTLPLDNPARMLSLQLNMAREQDFALDVDTTLAVSILAFNDFCDKKKVASHYSWKPDLGKTPLDENGKPKNRKDLKKAAPPNLGMPVVDGYPGLKEGRFDSGSSTEDFLGRTAVEIMEGARKDQGEERVKMILVTPEMAQDWLERFNRSNRKIMLNHVEMIKRDILNENWMVNAQPICFHGDPEKPSANGDVRLLNGQHRLMACIHADMPIEVPVAVNIPEEAFATFDVHAKRTRVHAGVQKVDDRVLSAAARLQWKQDNKIAFSTRMSPSATEIKQTIERHPDMLEHFQRSKKFTKIASGGVMTWFIYHVHQDDASMADDFLNGLEKGEQLERGNPILSLRMELIGQRGARSRVDVLATLLEGWEKYRKWRKRHDAKQEQEELI